MSLVRIKKNTFVDTDDLDNPEYHYYCRVKDMIERLPYNNENYRFINKCRGIKRAILCGELSAHEIETNPKYEWLRR